LAFQGKTKEVAVATNLVSLVMQSLTPDMIAKIATALGLDRASTQKAVGGAIPAILSGLAAVASVPSGARQLSGAISQQGPGMLDRLGSLIAGSGQRTVEDTGSSLLSGLLGGDTMDALAQSVGKFAGIGDGAGKSLLGLLGPVVIGALGQQQRISGLDAGGLASLLTAQKSQIADAIPSDLMDHLDASGVIAPLQSGVQSGAAAVSRIGGAAGRATTRATPAYAADNSAAYAPRSAPAWQWPVLGIGGLVLAGLAWYVIANSDRENVAEVQQPAVKEAAPSGRTLESAPVSLNTPGLTVDGVNLASKVTASVGGLRSTLAGIKDAASAEAALPKIRDAVAQFEDIHTMSEKLPPAGRSALARLIAAVMPTVSQLCDRVLATPGVSGIAKPTIDELRGKLDTLAKVG
jgi:hypothetical protein